MAGEKGTGSYELGTSDVSGYILVRSKTERAPKSKAHRGSYTQGAVDAFLREPPREYEDEGHRNAYTRGRMDFRDGHVDVTREEGGQRV